MAHGEKQTQRQLADSISQFSNVIDSINHAQPTHLIKEPLGAHQTPPLYLTQQAHAAYLKTRHESYATTNMHEQMLL